ncbi:hypothetical protein ACEYW6_36115 [Nostoc sp. UIC 10607]|uniref:hypothetical protein n=1 Tax=Nostoc sp. UIC 10607 TaxID=3045935 RepID=UPI0039A32204
MHINGKIQASNILNNKIGLDAAGVKQSYQELLTEISQQKQKAGTLNTAIDNFIKTTHNYWSGLFHCYEIEDFPRTNNDLEHAFGMLRHHQRRCTGRKVAPSSLVIRGSVKLACAIATKLHSFTASDLAQVDIHNLARITLSIAKTLRIARIEQYRFRRDPKGYLANLESRLL